MESLIETFHVDIKLLVAQIINFAIVFSVLYFFALKPLLKIMQDRTKTIEKSMDDAKKIEENLERTEEDYNKKLNIAKKDANAVLEKAKNMAEEKKGEMINKAKEEIGQIIETEKAKMQAEKAKTLKEIKKEVADLVFTSLEKVIDEKLDKKKDMNMIKKMIK